MSQKEIKALIKLLDDTDREVYAHIESKLVSFGREIIPLLEDAWSSSFDALMQQRIENIIHRIQFDVLKDELKKWAGHESPDLLKGALLVARYQYPDLDEKSITEQIAGIRRDIWLELNDQLTALEKVRIINHILFDIHGFKGNTASFHAPQNSFFNIVLESKKGNPLSLSILYSIIARGLDLPIYGINLPEHFIMAYMDEHTGSQPKVLFYINAFSRGTVFGKKEIDAFLKQLKMQSHPSFYFPCSNTDMIRRLLRNLINSYEKLGYPEKVEEITRLMEILK